jgi:hypothetical protein
MSTPRHRADAVEESSRAPASARLPGSDTPIYDALVGELAGRHAIRWPDHDPDPPTERFPALPFPDGWFAPLPVLVGGR